MSIAGLVADISPLRASRDLRLLMLPGSISLLGSEITAVAVAFQVYEITRSPLAVGMLGLCALVPILTVSFLGGVMADTHDRRKVVFLCNLALAGVSALLALNATLERPSLAAIYVLAVANASIFSLQRPAVDAMIPRLVAAEHLTATSALSGLTGSLGMMLGPAIAGVLIAAVGLGPSYAVDAVTFVLAAVCVFRIRPVPVEDDAEGFSIRNLFEGLRFLRNRPVLQATFLVDTIAMVFGMPLALLPAVAAERYAGNPRALGLMYAAPAVGAFVVSATSGWTGRVRRHGRALIVAAVVWGCCVVVFGVVHPLWAALATLAVAGASDMVSGIFRMTIWNRTIPDSHRGRLAGVTWANVASGPALGDLEAGAVARLTSVTTSIVSGGILCVVGVVAAALWLRPAWSYDDSDPTP